jgi:LemA protein
VKRAVLFLFLFTAIGIFVGTQFLSVRRNLVSQRALIEAQWAELSDAFDQRAELVAHFTDVVKQGSNSQDRVFTDEANAQSAFAHALAPQAKIEANSQLMNAFARLYVVAEAHPKLTSSESYRRLNEEIGYAEGSVAIERRKYNDLLEHYNAQLQRFPSNVVAAISGLQRIDAYVRTEQEAR